MTMPKIWTALGAIALVLSMARPAAAHILLESPPGRSTEYANDYPCGGFPRGKTTTPLQGGQKLTVVGGGLNPHGGYYRVALSLANDQGFEDHVLVDHVPESPKNGQISIDVTIPKVSCTACTLQLIQINNPDQPVDGANYYGCADVSIETSGVPPVAPSDAGSVPDAGRDAGSTASTDGGTASDGSAGGCSMGGGSGDAWIAIGVVALGVLRSRRRRGAR